MKRLAGRVRSIDILGSGYVIHDSEGWEITATGREFLRSLEAVTQDNLPPEAERSASNDDESTGHTRAALIVVGHRFTNLQRQR